MKTHRVWPEERLDRLRGLRAEGLTWAAIAEVLGTTPRAVREAAYRIGLYVRRVNTRIEWSEQQEEFIRQFYPAGDTKKLAEQLGVTPRQLRSKASKLGVAKTPEEVNRHREILRCRETLPHQRYKKLGTVSMRKQGPMIRNPYGQWVKLPRAIWQLEGREIPQGYVVVYKQGKEGILPHKLLVEDLECIPRSEQVKRNRTKKQRRATTWTINRRRSRREFDFSRRHR